MNRFLALISVPARIMLALSMLSLANPANANLPACLDATSDIDGDGYGWENNQSCIVQHNAAPGFLACASAASDFDGDGYGWENNASCMVMKTNLLQDDPGGTTMPECQYTASDSDGDGYGWENAATCVVTANTKTIGSANNAGSGSSNMGQNNAGSGSSDMGQGGDADNYPTKDGGNYTSSTTGDTVIRTSSLNSGSSREICTQSDGDWFSWTTVGDFILHTNTWAAWATPDYDWSQCIYTNKNGALAGVSYDWGVGRGPSDYQVRSYPELIYGIKDEYRAMPKSLTGLPESISNLPGITIDYAMNWPEYGQPRAVVASANSRYPNGTIIEGERNVSIESFFYNPDENGDCSESVVQRSEGSNHTYEIMVWLNAGAERLPAGPGDYVTDVVLDGKTYKAYTKNSDRKYIAFVAQNPQQSGSLNWNTFIDWSRQYAHQVQALFGAQTNSVAMQDNWCVGNIIVGTEIFWGKGNLDFIDWTITQTR